MEFSNPQFYYTELASPLCRRFEAERASYELAIATCIILYHFSDVVAHVTGKTVNNVSIEISEKIPEFSTIRAIANATKHVQLRRHPNPDLIGLRSDDLRMGKAAAFDGGIYWDGNISWQGSAETVVVVTPDGKMHDVLYVCLTTLQRLAECPEFF